VIGELTGSNWVDLGLFSSRFDGGDLGKYYLGSYGDLAAALAGMAITIGICRFLYHRSIFLRI
jgi:hypothetical protein